MDRRCSYISYMASKRRKPREGRKDDEVRVRVTSEEKGLWTASAKADGRDLSGWLRYLANREARAEHGRGGR
jgi:hypothetical protein